MASFQVDRLNKDKNKYENKLESSLMFSDILCTHKFMMIDL